jgi:hypothetical protein
MKKLAVLVAALALAAPACGPQPIPAVTLKMRRAPETPKNASVSIDEQYIGPLVYVGSHGVRLPIGTHRITVEKDGYFPFDQLVTSDRDDIELIVKLEPIPD